MNILITGVPCTGKTTIAKEMSKFGFEIYSDKDFITKQNSKIVNEYGSEVKEVDLVNFSRVVNSKLKNKKNVILEGIIFPYCLNKLKMTFDYIFVLSLPEKILRKRYKERRYAEVKILDNLFVQENKLLYEVVLSELQKSKKQPIIAEIKVTGNLSRDLSQLINVIYLHSGVKLRKERSKE